MDVSEQRLREVPWRALAGIASALDAPLAAVLAGEPAERIVDRFLRAHRELGSDERVAVKEAIYGLAVWRRRLAWHACQGRRGTSPRPTQSQMDEAGITPRAFLAALLRDLGGAAEAEALAGLPAGTLPAPRPPPEDPAIRYSLPAWLWATLQREAGAEAAALADALNAPGPVCLRPNLVLTTPGTLAERLAAEGVTTRPGRLVPGALVVTSARPNVYGLAAFREALFEVQDEASQLAGGLVAAQPGATVLDACAGAGGKALQLAAAVGPGGAVHATDPDLDRLPSWVRSAAAPTAASTSIRPPSTRSLPCSCVSWPPPPATSARVADSSMPPARSAGRRTRRWHKPSRRSTPPSPATEGSSAPGRIAAAAMGSSSPAGVAIDGGGGPAAALHHGWHDTARQP